VLLTKTISFERGDICGFAWNNKLLIKRVIGLPGDWIEMDKDGTVYLNGAPLDEPYANQISYGECDLEFRYQVPQEQYFVLGDMRESSIDSRNTLVGCVENEQILGKVFLRVWPFSSIKLF
jgi:signal peptidase I